MKLVKMHGIGNDYIFADCLGGGENAKKLAADPHEFAVKISDRHTGVGSDGLILICPSDNADCEMRVYNADGSYAYMCGNGVRCVGKYLYDNGYINKDTADIESGGKVRHLKLITENGVCTGARVNMGKPSEMDVILPSDEGGKACAQKKEAGYTAEIKGREYTLVSMGNPHAVTFTDSADAVEIEKAGPEAEHDAIFPDRANIEFAEVTGPNALKMRVWERGSGETMACGTGACAAAAASIIKGRCRPGKVTVELKGGTLVTEWDGKDGDVYMTGPAEYICEINNFKI